MVDREMLKPCPFCGGEAKRLTLTAADGADNAGGDVIGCTKCGAGSHVEFGRKENLVSAWNTRAAIEATHVGELVSALEKLVSAFSQIDADYIGESMHTGLRKGSDADDAHKLWKAIADSRTAVWSDAAAFTVDCIDFHFGKDLKLARAALSRIEGGQSNV